MESVTEEGEAARFLYYKAPKHRAAREKPPSRKGVGCSLKLTAFRSAFARETRENYALATPSLFAASATALATAGPTRVSNAEGMT